MIASGLGRSGTTVLRNCICSHPQIAGCNAENNYIHDLMRAADQNMEYGDRVKNMVVTEAAYWSLHQQLLLRLIWPTDKLADVANKKVISTYSMLDPRAAIGLEKSFPKLVICYIIRNGIEVVSSYMSFAPFKHMTFTQICQLWSHRLDMYQFANQHANVFLFRHEWLLQPSRFLDTLSQALEFVGLENDPLCESPIQTVFHPTRYRGESKQDVADLSRRNERWKYWSQPQRDEFVLLCGEAMKTQGYEIPWL
jgi:hypothetical protein